MSIKKLSSIAMLTALNVVLALATPVKLINFKFTFEAFPILVAALLMGPVEGMLTGLLGSGLYQILFSGYGITPTTPLWMLPHALSGLVVGLLGRRINRGSIVQVATVAILSALLVTAFNTLALYVDSKMFGYYSDKLVFGALALKVAAGIILAGIYALILPGLIARLRPIVEK